MFVKSRILVIEANNPFEAFSKIDVSDPAVLGELWVECEGKYFGITFSGETYEIK